MSEDQQIEQITKEPEQKIERVKDPKKVAAGKRLAEYHKRAKQALKREKELIIDENDDTFTDEDNNSTNNIWSPNNISITTILTVIGISLTALDLYLRYRKNDNDDAPTMQKIKYEERKLPTPSSMNELQLAPKQSKIPRKIGME